MLLEQLPAELSHPTLIQDGRLASTFGLLEDFEGYLEYSWGHVGQCWGQFCVILGCSGGYLGPPSGLQIKTIKNSLIESCDGVSISVFAYKFQIVV